MLSILMITIFMTLFFNQLTLHTLIYFFYFIFNYFLLGFYFSENFSCISLNFGLDKYSFSLILLTSWICLMMMYSSFSLKILNLNYVKMLILLIFFFLILCFFSLTFFYFYIYFECSVLPLFLLIYGWGYQPERVYASLYFIMFTLFSSLPLFLLILKFEHYFGFFYFNINYEIFNFYTFFFFIFALLVKLPMVFFHLWLPSAHVEAPSLGSMILAGVMLKLGGYGLIRFLMLFCYLLNLYSYIFISLSLVGCLYISMFCLIQVDLKVLIAYSSVSHMGLVICGLMNLSMYGTLGGFFLMISHGLVSSGLFFLVGCIYDRFGTRSIFLMRGLLNFMPSFVMFFFILCISNMSCPPSLNLVSEIFICFSLLSWDPLTLLFIFFILFFTACSMINLFSFVCHGAVSNLIFFVDSGTVREYYCFFMHLFPLYMFVINLDFFN
uniref:NADH-ubiquinone oxidoreductase chain 4 n=1 Tax=Epeurysa nawaii TaxID=1308479 RepID=A0A7S5DBL4_9HEMI|nr:NADH dehydrogenase subunit 4 [Epeurysa nawaii]